MLVNLELTNKNILIVGGGAVALRKTKKLLNYDCSITLVSLDVLPEFHSLDINIFEVDFEYKYLNNIDILFLCTDNAVLHNEIIEYAKNKKILINNSTSQTNMDFAMSASFEFNDYEIAVTSHNGVSANKDFKNRLAKLLGEELK